MKSLLLTTLFISGFYVNSQTDVIAIKSHSGDYAEIEFENSNFGLDESMLIDSVIYLGNDCYVEVRNAYGNFQSRDTICDNPYFKEHGYSLESAQQTYRSRTVLVGFKNSKKLINNSEKWQKSNKVYWLVGLLFLLSIFYIIRPLKN